MGAASVRYREIQTKTALTRVQGMPFGWSLNPYRGCSHGCTYCYAREYHALMGRDTGAGFDREVEVKVNFADVLALELRRLRARDTVALGTGTDPYQPCEGRYRITRKTLEVLAQDPLPLVVVTKGTLVVRDVDLYTRIARAASVRICVSIGTVDPQVARTSEPDAPPPRSRLEAIRRLRTAGIEAGVLCAPVLPDLTDSDASLEAVAAAARDHGAAFFHIRPLKLDPGVRPHYFTFLAEQFPALLAPTAARFADRVRPTSAYADELERRVDVIRERYGFSDLPASPPVRTVVRSRTPEPAQLRLAI